MFRYEYLEKGQHDCVVAVFRGDKQRLLEESVIRYLPFLIGALCLPMWASAQSPNLNGCNVFPANNVWNARIDSLPVAANSSAYVETIGSGSGAHPEFGSDPSGGIPITFVSGSQPKVPISFLYESDPGPYPIPANPLIEGGVSSTGDRHILVVDTTNCIDYELYSAHPNSDGSWTASAGAVFALNSNQLRPAGWTSADAAGLPILPGLVRYDEVLSGTINHALRFSAPVTDDNYIWPARHEASSASGSQYPPMGQRFRLKASFDVSSYPAHVQVILNALKTYGMILADNGGPWFITGVPDARWNDDEMHTLTQVTGNNFEAVDESGLQVDPNSAQAGGGPAAPTPTSSGFVPNTWLQVVSQNGGNCLNVIGGSSATGAGIRLDQEACTGATSQAFLFVPVAGGYEVTVRSSSLQLDIDGASPMPGTPIIQWPYWGGRNEIWSVTSSTGGAFTIAPLSTGMCLDTYGGSSAAGTGVMQWPCWGGINQQWTFTSAQ